MLFLGIICLMLVGGRAARVDPREARIALSAGAAGLAAIGVIVPIVDIADVASVGTAIEKQVRGFRVAP
jgi:hypothetical protein